MSMKLRKSFITIFIISVFIVIYKCEDEIKHTDASTPIKNKNIPINENHKSENAIPNKEKTEKDQEQEGMNTLSQQKIEENVNTKDNNRKTDSLTSKTATDIKSGQFVHDSFDPYADDWDIDDDDDEHKNEHEDDHIPLDKYDFDPSEGLSFIVPGGKAECFQEEIKTLGDEIGGAYVVASASSKIEFLITSPTKEHVFQKKGEVEAEYFVTPKTIGVYDLCFKNTDSEDKLVTHVTNTLQSHHPVEKEHVSMLAKYVSHIDIRLGELESEQRLLQLRTERHLKIEKRMNESVSFYGILESLIYVIVSLLQIYYIKRLLENPYKSLMTRDDRTNMPRRWA